MTIPWFQMMFAECGLLFVHVNVGRNKEVEKGFFHSLVGTLCLVRANAAALF